MKMPYLDGILGEHAAVELHWRQTQMLRNITVLDCHNLVQGFALHPADVTSQPISQSVVPLNTELEEEKQYAPFGRQATAGNGRAAPESLEARVYNISLVVHLATEKKVSTGFVSGGPRGHEEEQEEEEEGPP